MSTIPAVEYLAKGFPPITGVRWFNLAVLVITPALSLHGLFRVPILTRTVIWTALYYCFSMLGKPHDAALMHGTDTSPIGITAGEPQGFAEVTVNTKNFFFFLQAIIGFGRIDPT